MPFRSPKQLYRDNGESRRRSVSDVSSVVRFYYEGQTAIKVNLNGYSASYNSDIALVSGVDSPRLMLFIRGRFRVTRLCFRFKGQLKLKHVGTTTVHRCVLVYLD